MIKDINHQKKIISRYIIVEVLKNKDKLKKDSGEKKDTHCVSGAKIRIMNYHSRKTRSENNKLISIKHRDKTVNLEFYNQ